MMKDNINSQVKQIGRFGKLSSDSYLNILTMEARNRGSKQKEIWASKEEPNNPIDHKVRIDKRLHKKFSEITPIGEGCFGHIYRATNKLTNEEVALKIEMEDLRTRRSNLAIEIALLTKLQHISGVPKIYSSGKWHYGIYMEMELLTSSLNDEKEREFTVNQIQSIGVELIHILQQIHANNIIHQDLKPQNIMRNKKGGLVIIDFGLSSLLPRAQVPKSKKIGFIGTPRYASIAAHQGVAQNPKDDIESLLYVLGFLKKKRAPWFYLKCPVSERLGRIEKLKIVRSEDWLLQCGGLLSAAYSYIRELDPNTDPDYAHLTKLLQTGRKTVSFKPSPKERAENRRHTDNQKNLYSDVPFLAIDYKNRDREDNDGTSAANFSTLAQDNYLETIQLLTDFLLKVDESEVCGSVETPSIRDPTKYKGIDFKNPFS